VRDIPDVLLIRRQGHYVLREIVTETTVSIHSPLENTCESPQSQQF